MLEKITIDATNVVFDDAETASEGCILSIRLAPGDTRFCFGRVAVLNAAWACNTSRVSGVERVYDDGTGAAIEELRSLALAGNVTVRGGVHVVSVVCVVLFAGC